MSTRSANDVRFHDRPVYKIWARRSAWRPCAAEINHAHFSARVSDDS